MHMNSAWHIWNNMIQWDSIRILGRWGSRETHKPLPDCFQRSFLGCNRCSRIKGLHKVAEANSLLRYAVSKLERVGIYEKKRCECIAGTSFPTGRGFFYATCSFDARRNIWTQTNRNLQVSMVPNIAMINVKWSSELSSVVPLVFMAY